MTWLSDVLSSASALVPNGQPALQSLGLKGVPYPTSSYGGTGGAFADMMPWIRPGSSAVDYSTVDAMGSDIVMACVNSVARVFPEARMRVTKPGPEGVAEEVNGHELARLVSRPNAFMSGSEFWAATVCDYMRGNAYWLKVRARQGRTVRELMPLPGGIMRAKWPKDGSAWVSYYEMWTPSGWVRIETEDIVHFKNPPFDYTPGRDGRYGSDPLAPVLREIYTDQEAGRWVAALLRNEARPGLALSLKDSAAMAGYDTNAIKAFVAQLQQQLTGDNRGRSFFVPVPVDLKKVAFDPEEMNLTSLRRIAEERISALLNVPAIVAGLGAGLDRSTYANMEEAYRQLWVSNVRPMQRVLSEKVDAELLPDFPNSEGASTSFDTTQVEALQESRTEAEERAGKALARGGITLNEYRSRLGEDPLPDGDVLYIPNTHMAVAPDELLADAPAPEIVPPALMAASYRAPLRLKAAPQDDPDDAGRVTPKDREDAAAYWREHAPDGLGGLLDAEDADEDEEKGFRWDGDTYTNDAGADPKPADVRDALASVLGSVQRDLADVLERVDAGTASTADFRVAMHKGLKRAHLTALAAARGGWDQLTARDYSRAGGILASEFRHLNRAASQLETYFDTDGAEGRSVKSIAGNLDMWTGKALDTFDDERHDLGERKGHKWERWYTSGGDSCEGCLAQEARGVVRFGELPRKGSQPCGGRCHCTKTGARTKRELAG